MEQTNIAQFKSRLSEFLARVEAGESVEICRRNVSIARVSPTATRSKNRTVLGCGEGTVVVRADLTEPVLDAWEMSSGDLSR